MTFEQVLDEPGFESAAKIYFIFIWFNILWCINLYALVGLNFLEAAKDTMDATINTLPFTHAYTYLKQLLKPNRKVVQVGERSNLEDLLQLNLTLDKTQEMIDFAAEHNITVDVELIPMKDVNRAMTRLDRADVKYCFVIDVAKTLGTNTGLKGKCKRSASKTSGWNVFLPCSSCNWRNNIYSQF